MTRITPVIPGTRAELADVEARIVKERGRISPLYQILLNSPSTTHGWEQMLTAVRNRSSVPANLRELMILRVAVLNKAPYEFEAHVPHAQNAGLSDEKIAAVKNLLDNNLYEFNLLEQEVLHLTDSMTRDIEVPDSVFEPLRQRYSEHTLVDLVATVAAYNMVSRFLTALHIHG